MFTKSSSFTTRSQSCILPETSTMRDTMSSNELEKLAGSSAVDACKESNNVEVNANSSNNKDSTQSDTQSDNSNSNASPVSLDTYISPDVLTHCIFDYLMCADLLTAVNVNKVSHASIAMNGPDWHCNHSEHCNQASRAEAFIPSLAHSVLP